jgi:CheY-like chemotaxis protein
VELHGGSVAAQSAGHGQGSEFVVRLPLSPSPAAPAELRRSAKQESKRLEMLVVDDNHDAAFTTAQLLRHAGHEVRTAHSGLEALDAALAHRPDAILLDLGLPEIDGYGVARRLRRQPGFEDVILIAVSGYGQESDKQRSAEAGCDAHLVKPVEIGKIVAVLEALLGKRRSEDR